MSNFVFPNLKGVEWNVQLTPYFSNLLQEAVSGKEVRAKLWVFPRYEIVASYSLIRAKSAPLINGLTELQTLLGFFKARAGSVDDFLLNLTNLTQDAADSAATGQLVGYGDGSAKSFQLYKSADNSLEAMQFALPSAVYINGSPVNAGPNAAGGQMWYCGVENLALYSQVFQNAAWGKSGTGVAAPVVTDNAIVAPDNASTAATVALPTTVGGQFSDLYQTIPIAATGTQFTASIWMKVGSGTATVQLFLGDGTYGNQNETLSVNCNLTTSWQRFTVTGTFSLIANSQNITLYIRQPASTASVTIDVWGAQVERWSAASSYTVTTSAQLQTKGVVSFNSAPAAAAKITADYSYWYPVRFNTSETPGKRSQNSVDPVFSAFYYQLFELKQLSLLTVKR